MTRSKTVGIVLLAGWLTFWLDAALACWTLQLPAAPDEDRAPALAATHAMGSAPEEGRPGHEGPHCISAIAAPGASSLWPLATAKIALPLFLVDVVSRSSASDLVDTKPVQNRATVLRYLSDMRLRL